MQKTQDRICITRGPRSRCKNQHGLRNRCEGYLATVLIGASNDVLRGKGHDRYVLSSANAGALRVELAATTLDTVVTSFSTDQAVVVYGGRQVDSIIASGGDDRVQGGLGGDQRAQLIGIETQLNITADKPSFGTYAWGETSWAVDGSLNGGVTEANFSDVIYGSAGNDKINGLGGNDALDGGAGDDEIDGGIGDDLIGGGAGSDNILGGDGNDFISSGQGLTAAQRLKPTDQWSLPTGATLINQGSTWGSYLQDNTVIWNTPNGVAADAAPDVVDSGAGDDYVFGGNGVSLIKSDLEITAAQNHEADNIQMVAIELIAVCANSTGATGRIFDHHDVLMNASNDPTWRIAA